ncbi:MAG TPA: hypothetical protein VGK32_07825 [Vicinamibacterales bacterium]|jgi:hypothetical protein
MWFRERWRLEGSGSAEGSALIVVLMALLLLSAMALSMLLATMVETLSTTNVRSARVTLWAAEAGVERVLPDLLRAPDWDAVLSGAITSGFKDGPSSGPRQLSDGRTLDLQSLVNLANCSVASGCSESMLDMVSEDRPWGHNNPRWQLFAHAPLSALGGAEDDGYLVVLVADDPSENDDDPVRDGRGPGNPGAGVLMVRAEAFGPNHAHRVVEATIARLNRDAPEVGYGGQRGAGRSSSDGAARQSVQVPGGTINRTEWAVPAGGPGGQ